MCVDNKALAKKKMEDVKDASCNIYEYNGNDSVDLLKKLFEDYKSRKTVSDDYIFELFTGHKKLCDEQIECYDFLTPVDIETKIENMRSTIATFNAECKEVLGESVPVFEVLDPQKEVYVNNLLKNTSNIKIYEDLNEEYFAINTITGKRTMGEKDIHNISKAMINSILI